MKRIVIFLSIVALLGTAFVSYWVYTRYIQRPVSEPLSYRVERGDLKDLLHVRGDVAAEREYDLSFSSFGTVANVLVQEGRLVRAGDLLMKLDATDLELQLKQLYAEERRAQAASESASARLSQAVAARDGVNAQLDELKIGTRPEQLKVATSKVAGAQETVDATETPLIHAVKDSYTKADDAIHAIADQMMQNPRSTDPQLGFSIADGELRRNVELLRLGIEPMLVSWRQLAGSVASDSDLAQAIATTKTDLQNVSSFLDELALAVNEAIPSSYVSAATITAWQANLSLARSNINVALANVTDADAAMRSAQTSLTIAQNELQVLEAGSSSQQIAAQLAQVRQAEANIAVFTSGVAQADADVQIANAQIDIMREKIRKASIYAPGPARVTKLWLKANEQYQQSLQGMPAISLATTGIKVQSDISELDIPKVREQDGSAVTMVFDAFPGRTYSGKVISIEPKEIIKEGDTYYRVNYQIDGLTEDLRRGMSTDVTIQAAEKKGVLRVPVFTVHERSGKKYVTRLDQGLASEVEVRTGITDGDMIEITDGLMEGQTIIVSTE